jgi:hypothetical protein
VQHGSQSCSALQGRDFFDEPMRNSDWSNVGILVQIYDRNRSTSGTPVTFSRTHTAFKTCEFAQILVYPWSMDVSPSSKIGRSRIGVLATVTCACGSDTVHIVLPVPSESSECTAALTRVSFVLASSNITIVVLMITSPCPIVAKPLGLPERPAKDPD